MKLRAKSTRRDAYEQAAAWYVRRQRGSLSDSEQVEFERWRADPRHADAYAAAGRTWQLTERATAPDGRAIDPRVATLIDAARGHDRSRGRRVMLMALGLAGLLVIGGMLWNTGTLLDSSQPVNGLADAADPPPQDYHTAVGERSALTLEDGSQIFLNTDSRLRVDFSADLRRVTLLQGQALFEVAADRARPFAVSAAGHQIVALGTAFDVRLDRSELQVTLIEGQVGIDEADAGAGTTATETRLEPGEQYVVAGAGTPRVRPARVEQVTSWRDGKLIFTDEPLRTAVVEVNRYSTRKVVIGDAALGELRISGVFRTGHPDTFVDALTSYFPIEADSAPRGDLVLRASAN